MDKDFVIPGTSSSSNKKKFFWLIALIIITILGAWFLKHPPAFLQKISSSSNESNTSGLPLINRPDGSDCTSGLQCKSGLCLADRANPGKTTCALQPFCDLKTCTYGCKSTSSYGGLCNPPPSPQTESSLPTDDWAVRITKGTNASLLATKLGFTYKEPVGNLADTYVFTFENSDEHLAEIEKKLADPAITWHERQYAV